MRISIGKIGESKTVAYAAEELARYLKKIDKSLLIDMASYEAYEKNVANVIFIGMMSEENDKADRIEIKIKDGAGYITGSNERSVLIAVYKFLESLGCKWLRPGEDGEFITKRKLNKGDISLELDHIPSYNHRGVTIEGSCTYESVYADYFATAFERNGEKYEAYVREMSQIWDREENESGYDELTALINKTLPVIKADLETVKEGSAYELSLKYLLYHAEFWLKLIPGVRAKANGDKDGARAAYDACVEYLYSVDGEIGRGADYCEYKNMILRGNVGFALLK